MKASIDLTLLREALEASWDSKTSYRAVSERNNPALGPLTNHHDIDELYVGIVNTIAYYNN